MILLQKFVELVPFLFSGGMAICLVISVLLRYCEPFQEFWARHICAWMEEHTPNSEEVQTPKVKGVR